MVRRTVRAQPDLTVSMAGRPVHVQPGLALTMCAGPLVPRLSWRSLWCAGPRVPRLTWCSLWCRVRPDCLAPFYDGVLALADNKNDNAARQKHLSVESTQCTVYYTCCSSSKHCKKDREEQTRYRQTCYGSLLGNIELFPDNFTCSYGFATTSRDFRDTRIIDADGSGTLHIAELVQGLLKIRGEAGGFSKM